MRRTRLMLITTIFAVFAMTGLAFAANQGFVNVTSEPVAQGTACAKAGGFSIEFDAGTTLTAGDQITIDLDLGVTLCKDIDLLIAPTAGAAGSGWLDGTVVATSSPVTAPHVATTPITSTGNGVVFLITGNSGSARITVDVLEADLDGDGSLGTAADTAAALATGSVTVAGATADDKLILAFLGQRTNADFTTNGIWSNTDQADYVEAATLAQNTICIDVATFTGTTVKGNMDSKGDKFTFIPSNPQIAHIVAAGEFQLEECKDRSTGNIPLGESAGQGTSETCDSFDNDVTSDFCSNVAHANNGLIIRSVNSAFDQVNYDVTIEILVNGVSGDNGVYFSNTALRSQGYDTEEDACDGSGVAVVGGTTKYYNSADTTVTPAAPASNDCSVKTTARAVKLVVSEDDLDLGATNDYLFFDLPPFNYDLTEVAEDDVVSVRVTLSKSPCTTVFTGDWEIGTFGCVTATVSKTLTFPYFTATSLADTTSGSGYWDGIVVTNLTSADGTITSIKAYEKDGDVATASLGTDATVPANSMLVKLLSSITWTQTSGSGTFGDSPCYIVVTTSFNADGFAMIAKTATGESMGYLPRLASAS